MLAGDNSRASRAVGPDLHHSAQASAIEALFNTESMTLVEKGN
jgi:hypothetical protein